MRDVDFGDSAPAAIEVAMAALHDGGTVEFRLDRQDGPLLGSVSTDGSSLTYSCPVQNADKAAGVHDVYLVFRGGDGRLFDVDYWKMTK